MIDMPVLQQVCRMLVVRHQQTASRERFLKERKKFFQVSGCCSLSDHHPLPFPYPFHGFLRRGALVIVSNSGRNVPIQHASGKKRRMSIDCKSPFFRVIYLFPKLPVTGRGRMITHDFPQAQNSGMIIERPDIFCLQTGAGLIKFCRRNTGRDHKIHHQRQSFAGLQHKLNSPASAHIRDFMRGRHHSGGSMGKGRPCEFCRKQHAAFNMNMPVDKARTQVFPGNIFCIIRIFFRIISGTRNPPIFQKNLRSLQLPCKNINDCAVFQQRFHRTLLHLFYFYPSCRNRQPELYQRPCKKDSCNRSGAYRSSQHKAQRHKKQIAAHANPAKLHCFYLI